MGLLSFGPLRIYSLSILCVEHHYCGDQLWRSLTKS